jgi:hypothetical protein
MIACAEQRDDAQSGGKNHVAKTHGQSEAAGYWPYFVSNTNGAPQMKVTPRDAAVEIGS